MMTVSSYSSYESAGLQNVEFTSGNPATSGGTPLYAWCESGCTNSVSSVLWVNLGSSTIGASGGTLTVYMNFMPSNVMTSSTAYIGEAPQLYGGSYAQASYAQYDNGATVFTNYWNFAGTSTPSGWTLGTGWSVNTGLTTAAGTGTEYNAYSGTSSTPPVVEDFYANMPASASNHDSFGFFSSAYSLSWAAISSFVSSGAWFMYATGVGASDASYYSGLGVYTLNWISSSSANLQFNYGSAVDSINPSQSSSLAVGGYSYQGSAFTINWLRLRAYPPSGVMPTAGFGSVV